MTLFLFPRTHSQKAAVMPVCLLSPFSSVQLSYPLIGLSHPGLISSSSIDFGSLFWLLLSVFSHVFIQLSFFSVHCSLFTVELFSLGLALSFSFGLVGFVHGCTEYNRVHYGNYPRLFTLSCPLLQISLRFITWPDKCTTNQPLRCALGWVCSHGPFARTGLSCLLFLIAPLQLTSTARWVCVPGCVGVRLHGMSARKTRTGGQPKRNKQAKSRPSLRHSHTYFVPLPMKMRPWRRCVSSSEKGPSTTLHVFSFLELPCFSHFNRFNPWKNRKKKDVVSRVVSDKS